MINNIENLDYKYLIQTQKKGIVNKVNERAKKVLAYDFKIISFRLGKEFYGIDIMFVKEIKKVFSSKFTFVPNTLDFVLGVLNLRGEIITVIDLAKLFHLEPPESKSENKDNNKKTDEEKSIIVIKVEDIFLGLVVEEITRVIPLKKSDIQPPSPLLGNINEKYIKGVAEINEKLYVIFDTNAIFSSKGKMKKEVFTMESEISEDFFIHFCNQVEEHSSIDINEFNKSYFKELYNQYIKENNITTMPTIDKETSDEIVKKFYSMHTDEFWDTPYINYFKDIACGELEKICAEEIRVLVAGCGNGYEAFSLFILLSEYFNKYDIKMIAADSNLSKISNASGLEVLNKEIPSWVKIDKYFMKVGNNVYKIKKEVNNKIYFEFHDLKNLNSISKDFDIIIARDLSLYLPENYYKVFISAAHNKLISQGLLLIGDNEILTKSNDFIKIPNNKKISLYKKI